MDHPALPKDTGAHTETDEHPAPDAVIESVDAFADRVDRLASEGQLDGAVEQWRDRLGSSPDPDEAVRFARFLMTHGRPADAQPWLKQALAARPGMNAARRAQGESLLQLGRHDEAAAALEALLAIDPDDIEACGLLGNCLLDLKRPKDALPWLQKAADRQPGNVNAAIRLGDGFRDNNEKPQAIEVFRQALSIDPQSTRAMMALGGLLIDARQYDEAAGLFETVTAREVQNVYAWLSLGSAYLGGRRYAESLLSFRRALGIQPSSAVGYCNMALALFSLNRLDEAVEACKTALVIEPGSPVAQFNMSCVLLTMGRYREGWEAYDFRGAGPGKTWVQEAAHAAPWEGQPLAGKSILVIGEQGNGDHLQFIRYLAGLHLQGAKVSCTAPERLHAILGTVPGAPTMLNQIPQGARFDYQCRLMSLPRWFIASGIPEPAVPYLFAQPERVERWRKTIGTEGFRIAIVWQGNVYPNGDFRRSYRLESLLPIARLPGVRLISLQMGEALKQIDHLPGGMRVEQLGPDFDTGPDAFLDSAAVMEVVDLVISCDTSMAHLCGALGRPLWLALPSDAEWRWLRHRDETHWYPSARLFRQKALDDWDGVFSRMAEDLAGLLPEQRTTAASTAAGAVLPSFELSWESFFDRMGRLDAHPAPDAAVERTRADFQRALDSVGPQARPLLGPRGRMRDLTAQLLQIEDQLTPTRLAELDDEELARLVRQRAIIEADRAALTRRMASILGAPEANMDAGREEA